MARCSGSDSKRARRSSSPARRVEMAIGGLILEKPGNQIEGLIDKAQTVEDHGFDGFSHRQVSCLRVLLGGLIQMSPMPSSSNIPATRPK